MQNNLVLLLRVFTPFALGYFLSYLYRSVNAIIAPNLVADLGLDPTNLGLLTSAYLLTFAAFQLPLGILLDRFGPRRVEAALLLFAAAGAFIFARAESFASLVIGRALIGLGVSACLMAAFKAFVIWFPPKRLPLANGIQMISGGVGALAATTPVEAALRFTDWRGVFLALAVLTLLAALGIFMLIPEREGSHSTENMAEQLQGIRLIFASRVFWQIAPWAITAQAAFLSIIGLWSGPWLRDVAGYDRMHVADTLMGISLAMIVGFFVIGVLAERLSRLDIQPMSVAAVGMVGFIICQILLVAHWHILIKPLWLMFGFFGTASILPYAALSQAFPFHLAGRANTALNVLVFTAAFAAQWGLGAVIDLWPPAALGGYDPAGYHTGFALLVVLQIAGAVWWFIKRERN